MSNLPGIGTIKTEPLNHVLDPFLLNKHAVLDDYEAELSRQFDNTLDLESEDDSFDADQLPESSKIDDYLSEIFKLEKKPFTWGLVDINGKSKIKINRWNDHVPLPVQQVIFNALHSMKQQENRVKQEATDVSPDGGISRVLVCPNGSFSLDNATRSRLIAHLCQYSYDILSIGQGDLRLELEPQELLTLKAGEKLEYHCESTSTNKLVIAKLLVVLPVQRPVPIPNQVFSMELVATYGSVTQGIRLNYTSRYAGYLIGHVGTTFSEPSSDKIGEPRIVAIFNVNGNHTKFPNPVPDFSARMVDMVSKVWESDYAKQDRTFPNQRPYKILPPLNVNPSQVNLKTPSASFSHIDKISNHFFIYLLTGKTNKSDQRVKLEYFCNSLIAMRSPPPGVKCDNKFIENAVGRTVAVLVPKTLYYDMILMDLLRKKQELDPLNLVYFMDRMTHYVNRSNSLLEIFQELRMFAGCVARAKSESIRTAFRNWLANFVARNQGEPSFDFDGFISKVAQIVANCLYFNELQAVFRTLPTNQRVRAFSAYVKHAGIYQIYDLTLQFGLSITDQEAADEVVRSCLLGRLRKLKSVPQCYPVPKVAPRPGVADNDEDPTTISRNTHQGLHFDIAQILTCCELLLKNDSKSLVALVTRLLKSGNKNTRLAIIQAFGQLSITNADILSLFKIEDFHPFDINRTKGQYSVICTAIFIFQSTYNTEPCAFKGLFERLAESDPEGLIAGEIIGSLTAHNLLDVYDTYGKNRLVQNFLYPHTAREASKIKLFDLYTSDKAKYEHYLSVLTTHFSEEFKIVAQTALLERFSPEFIKILRTEVDRFPNIFTAEEQKKYLWECNDIEEMAKKKSQISNGNRLYAAFRRFEPEQLVETQNLNMTHYALFVAMYLPILHDDEFSDLPMLVTATGELLYGKYAAFKLRSGTDDVTTDTRKVLETLFWDRSSVVCFETVKVDDSIPLIRDLILVNYFHEVLRNHQVEQYFKPQFREMVAEVAKDVSTGPQLDKLARFFDYLLKIKSTNLRTPFTQYFCDIILNRLDASATVKPNDDWRIPVNETHYNCSCPMVRALVRFLQSNEQEAFFSDKDIQRLMYKTGRVSFLQKAEMFKLKSNEFEVKNGSATTVVLTKTWRPFDSWNDITKSLANFRQAGLTYMQEPFPSPKSVPKKSKLSTSIYIPE